MEDVHSYINKIQNKWHTFIKIKNGIHLLKSKKQKQIEYTYILYLLKSKHFTNRI